MGKYLSIGNVVCGILFILGIILAIRTFEQIGRSAPLIKNAVEIKDGKVLPENEGKLVLVSGKMTADGTAGDPDFEMTAESPYQDKTFYSGVKIGEFKLSPEYLDKLSDSNNKIDGKKLGEATVLAKQQDGVLTPYYAGDGEEEYPISEFYEGIVSFNKVIRLREDNNKLARNGIIVLTVLFGLLSVCFTVRNIVRKKPRGKVQLGF